MVGGGGAGEGGERERCRMDRDGGWWVNRTPPLVHNYALIALFSS